MSNSISITAHTKALTTCIKNAEKEIQKAKNETYAYERAAYYASLFIERHCKEFEGKNNSLYNTLIEHFKEAEKLRKKTR